MKNGSFFSAVMLVVVLGWCGAGRAASGESAEARSRAAVPTQVADEITRRMHRMGLNVLRAPLVQPYDPPGAVCEGGWRGDGFVAV